MLPEELKQNFVFTWKDTMLYPKSQLFVRGLHLGSSPSLLEQSKTKMANTFAGSKGKAMCLPHPGGENDGPGVLCLPSGPALSRAPKGVASQHGRAA